VPTQKWQQFEQEKEKLRRANLSPEEFTRRIRELAKKLKI